MSSALKLVKLATTIESDLLVLFDAPKGKIIITYCSVGYLSSALV